MEITPTTQTSGFQWDKLIPGDSFSARIISVDGEDGVVRVGNRSYQVRFEPACTKNFEGSTARLLLKRMEPLTVEVQASGGDSRFSNTPSGLFISPTLSVPNGRVVLAGFIYTQNSNSIVEINGRYYSVRGAVPDLFTARVVAPDTIEIVDLDIFSRNDIKNILFRLISESPSQIAGRAGLAVLNEPTAAGIKKLIEDSGLFFERKLLTGDDCKTDAKYKAALSGNTSSWDTLTGLQLAGLSMQNGILALFSSDELIDEGYVKVKKEKYGLAVYLYLNFTKLGKTLISIVQKDQTGLGFVATVRTAADISTEINSLDIKDLDVRWKRLNSGEFPENVLKSEIKITGFDVTA